MRVAYLVNQYPAISHSFIRREILALEKLGFEIMRISIRGWDSPLADQDDRFERERTRYILRTGRTTLAFAVARMALVRPIPLMRAIRLAWQMSRCSERPLHVHLAYVVEACILDTWLRDAGTEHLHAHFGTNSAEVAMLTHVLGGPGWSFTAHGIETFDNPRLVGLSEKVLRCAFAVAVTSYGRAQMYRAVPPECWDKIHVVHCGLDPGFSAEPGPAIETAPRIVCVGRLSPEKGHLVLLEAARRLAEDGVEFELVLAGDGELRGELEAKIAQSKLTRKVRITGWLSGKQVRDEILAARALVLTSFAEGLPVVLMEAMALRRPVITTFVAGIPELVRNGQDGWLVPAGDVTMLADAIQTCLQTAPYMVAKMGHEARERVLVRHDVNNEAGKLGRLFQLAVSKKRIIPG